MLYEFTRILIRLSTHALCRINANGIESVPNKGPLIVVSNHTGQLEVAVFFGLLAKRPITGWAKMEAWDNAFINWLFNLWGLIPLRRGEADTSALRKAVKALEEGYIFGIAPEGTRNITGRLKRAHPGAVILALHSGAPILPIVHWGGEKFLRNLVRFKRTDFYVRVGKPFKLKIDKVKITREIRQQITDEIMLHIAELLPSQYRGEYENMLKPSQPFTELVDIS